ncbi:MAG: hypothetical protein K0R28_904 [Paenibacillus sp.]|nr:hypothetical protein [Paenibacillus sp.]
MKKTSILSFQRKETMAAFLFVLPAFLGLAIFVFYPMINAFFTSFTDRNIINPDASFIGLDNYINLLSDKLFLKSLFNSFYFAVVVIPVQTAIALGLALLINKSGAISNVFRTIYFIPVVIAMGIASTVFKLIYNKDFGLLNTILGSLNLPEVHFLSDPNVSMIGLIILGIWKSAGFYMVILLSGLTTIPGDLYEAAEVDGANRWQKFVLITLPLLKRVMGFVVIITTMDAIKISTPIFILTEGGPAGSTTTIVFFIIKTAFQSMSLGYASAASFILFAIVLVISIFQLKFFKADTDN